MASSRKADNGECNSMNGEEMLFCCRKDSTSSAQGREVTKKDSTKFQEIGNKFAMDSVWHRPEKRITVDVIA